MFFKGTKYTCTFCKEMGMSITEYDGGDMTNHAQTGDACCYHCSISLSFKLCKFCNHFKNFDITKIKKYHGRCHLLKKLKYRDNYCDKWAGDLSFLEQ